MRATDGRARKRPDDSNSHGIRLMNAMHRRIEDPVRLIALTIISQCVEDREMGKPHDLEVNYWALRADIPEEWVDQLLGPGARAGEEIDRELDRLIASKCPIRDLVETMGRLGIAA